MIPVDSRFCSYCAADLTHTLNTFEMGSSTDAETVILNRGRGHAQSSRRGARDRMRDEAGGRRSHHRWRHPFLIVAAIFAISFIIRTIVLNSTVPASPPPYDSGSSVLPPDGALRDARLSTLRQALDDAGYENVQFRMRGDVLELTGTIPSEAHRVIVEVLAARATGGIPLRDRMRVHDDFADP